MDFDAFINTAWSDHGDHPAEVAERLAASAHVLTAAEHIPRFAALVTHVFGEHLSQFDRGVAVLEALRDVPVYDASGPAASAIARNVATLRYCGGASDALAGLATADRVAALAIASGAFMGQGRFADAIAAYDEAVAAGVDAAQGSPMARSLAVGGNNLAAALEEKQDRDAFETDAMVRAAECGLKYWKLAGTWLEEERAEYRLTRSLMQAGRPSPAIDHARRCIEVCRANGAPAFELFFGSAVLALAHRAAGDDVAYEAARADAMEHYALIPEEERRWCAGELGELGAES